MAFKASRDISVESQLADIEKNLDLVVKSLIGITPAVLFEILEPVLENAQTMTPVKTGRLKNSGYLEVVPEGTGGVIRAEIGFGRGGEPPYTIYVHEDMTKYHAPPTQAKFLQTAVDDMMGNIEDQLLRKYKQGVVLK